VRLSGVAIIADYALATTGCQPASSGDQTIWPELFPCEPFAACKSRDAPIYFPAAR
jgi:hypothetical protein